MSTALTNITAKDLSPENNLARYMATIGTVPILSAEEEKQCAIAHRDNNDLEAAKKMILSHLRFVVYIARGYAGYGLPLNDLIQEGNIGLMKAVKEFDPQRGVRLISFAVYWIRSEIHEYILRNWRIVKIATTKAQRKLFFNLRKTKSKLTWLNDQETNQVAADLGVSPKEVRTMEQRISTRDTQYDTAPSMDEDESWKAPANYLEDKNSDPAVLAENDDWENNMRDRMYVAINQLDARSKDILQRRWLATTGKCTLHDLGVIYGISTERVRQLEKNAIKKLQASLSN